MPHGIREEHLEDICAQCKQDPGAEGKLEIHNKKMYMIIHCQHCNYEIIKPEPVESTTNFVEKLLTTRKI